MNSSTYVDSTLPLVQLGAALGIDAGHWAKLEHVASVDCSNWTILREALVNLDVQLVHAACQFYGKALTGQIRFGNAPGVPLSVSLDRAAIDTLLNATPTNPIYYLDLTLDKSVLIVTRWGEKPNCRPFLFLFERALEALLVDGLPQLENRFFPRAQSSKAIFILPDREVFLDGPHLSLIGGTALTEYASIAATTEVESERASRVYQDCRTQLSWQQEWLKRLTPFHLALTARQRSDSATDQPESPSRVVDLLHLHFANLALIYTAQRSQVTEDRIVSLYTSAVRSVPVPLRHLSSAVAGEERRGANDLLSVICWTYDPTGQGSRVALVQDIFVRELTAVGEEQRASVVVQRSATILSQLSWSWQSFVGDKVDAYLAQVRELENDVDRTVQGFADQLAGLTKSLTDTMLGTVVAVLAAPVAAAISGEFKLWIFNVGVLSYFAYILIFHVWYGLGYHNDQFISIKQGFEARKALFAERIPSDQVNHVVGDRISDSESLWHRWYRNTKLAYGVLMVVLTVAIIVATVADEANQQEVSNTPTPAPTVQPVP